MKKTLNKVIVTLAAVAALAFGTSAMAATTTVSPITDGKATVTYETTAGAGEQVTVLLLKPGADKTEGVKAEDIAYIDQKAADTEGKVKFEMPISDVTDGQTYALMSGSESATTVANDNATFGTADEPIHYGDVNDDGDIDTSDASMVIRHYVGTTALTDAQKLCADVTKEGDIDISDASQMIKYYVGSDNRIDDSWKTNK